MKGTLPRGMAVVVVVLLVIVLTKIANSVQPTENQEATFWMERQKVVECTFDEITLEDRYGSQTHLQKDGSWPLCSVFRKGEVLDFQLARGERTHFLKKQPSAWWR